MYIEGFSYLQWRVDNLFAVTIKCWQTTLVLYNLRKGNLDKTQLTLIRTLIVRVQASTVYRTTN